MLLHSQSKSSVDSDTLLRIFIAVTKPKQLQLQPVRKHHTIQFFG